MSAQHQHPAQPIDVMIVDSFELTLAGLSSMVESNPDFRTVATAHNLEEAERYARGHKPGLALLGPNLNAQFTSSDQPHIVQAIKQASPETKILVMTRSESELPKVGESFESGADGAMMLSLSREGMLDVMYSVCETGGYVAPDIAHGMLRNMRKNAESTLTKREKDVLEGVAFGYTNAEIGKNLHLSVRTIETHRASITEKTGLQSRAELVHYAMQLGLLEEGDAHWQKYQAQKAKS